MFLNQIHEQFKIFTHHDSIAVSVIENRPKLRTIGR